MENNNQTEQKKKLQADVVVQHKCMLGEGPVWDAKHKVICWIDILQGEIHEYSTDQKTFRTIQVPQMIGAVALGTNGDFIGALQNGFGFIDRANGKVKMISNPEAHLPNNRFNDGKCDPQGRFFAGTMPLSEDKPTGNLYCLEKDLSVIKKIEGVTVSNGLAWSSDHKTFYYIDTPTREVVSYDYDKSTGDIKNKKTIIKVSEEDGFPDGMTIDAEDMLWIAHWGGWQVVRYNPENGQKMFHITLPAAHVTSCTFGGENLGDLYITTAKKDLTPEQLQNQPLAGALFVVPDCGYKGLPAFEFAPETNDFK